MLMNIATGVDIVDLKRFEKVLATSGEHFIDWVFLKSESSHKGIERLAGIFAAKEAVKKALNISGEVWQQIEVYHSASGKPEIRLHITPPLEIISADLSISHDGNSAVAVFVVLMKPKHTQGSITV